MIVGEPLPKPSLEEALKLDLKPLLEHLKYAYLGLSKTLLVIIISNQDPTQEKESLAILRENRGAIGWTMMDIKEISPSIIQYRIHLREEAKLTRDS